MRRYWIGKLGRGPEAWSLFGPPNEEHPNVGDFLGAFDSHASAIAAMDEHRKEEIA